VTSWLVLAEVFVLSLGSYAVLAPMFRLPERRPVPVPQLLAPVPSATPDWEGLV